jgi:hypothetical protein
MESREDTEATEPVIKSDSVVPEFKLVFTVDAKLVPDDSPTSDKSASMSQLTVHVKVVSRRRLSIGAERRLELVEVTAKFFTTAPVISAAVSIDDLIFALSVSVGAALAVKVNKTLTEAVSTEVGPIEGRWVGDRVVGLRVGLGVGAGVGAIGCAVGALDGGGTGSGEGSREGFQVGAKVGFLVGTGIGTNEGAGIGAILGHVEGSGVGR